MCRSGHQANALNDNYMQPADSAECQALCINRCTRLSKQPLNQRRLRLALVGASPHMPYPALAQAGSHAVQPHKLVQTTQRFTLTMSRAHIDIGGVKPADPTLGKVLCLLCWRDVWAVRQAQQGHSLPHQVVQLLNMLHHHQRGQRGLAGDANCTAESEGLSLRLCVLHREGEGTLNSRWDAACLGPSLTGACAAQGHLMPAACRVWPKWATDNRCTTAVGLASALHAGRAAAANGLPFEPLTAHGHCC